MTSVGTPVICSQCGKTLRGTPAVTRGFHVRRHKKLGGESWCRGHWSTDHRPAPQHQPRPRPPRRKAAR